MSPPPCVVVVFSVYPIARVENFVQLCPDSGITMYTIGREKYNMTTTTTTRAREMLEMCAQVYSNYSRVICPSNCRRWRREKERWRWI